MPNLFRCNECDYKSATHTANITSNNMRHGARTGYSCSHPEAVAVFNRICPRSPKMAGFIGYSYCGTKVLQMKNSPRWCPLKHIGEGGADG